MKNILSKLFSVILIISIFSSHISAWEWSTFERSIDDDTEKAKEFYYEHPDNLDWENAYYLATVSYSLVDLYMMRKDYHSFNSYIIKDISMPLFCVPYIDGDLNKPGIQSTNDFMYYTQVSRDFIWGWYEHWAKELRPHRQVANTAQLRTIIDENIEGDIISAELCFWRYNNPHIESLDGFGTAYIIAQNSAGNYEEYIIPFSLPQDFLGENEAASSDWEDWKIPLEKYKVYTLDETLDVLIEQYKKIDSDEYEKITEKYRLQEAEINKRNTAIYVLSAAAVCEAVAIIAMTIVIANKKKEKHG